MRDYNTVGKYAQRYVKLGFKPVPVEFRTKKPAAKDWNADGYEFNMETFESGNPLNVGIVLGSASGNLVDVDIDCNDALEIAPILLPSTGMCFGRHSKRRSHWVYKVAAVPRTRRLSHPVSRTTLVELRGEGGQTVFPPSVHPTGEVVEFDSEGEPSTVDAKALERRVALVAVGAVVRSYWTEGSRHHIALCISGLLADLGVSVNEAELLVRALALSSNDMELNDRVAAVATTYARSGRAEAVSGARELASVIGQKAVDDFRTWLGADSRETTSAPCILHGAVPSPWAMRSDADAAQQFAAAHKRKLLYDDLSGTWLNARDGVFEPVSQDKVLGIGTEFVKAICYGADLGQLSTVKSLLSLTRIRAMVQLARPLLVAEVAAMDAHKEFAGCVGGVLDLKAPKLVQSQAIITKRIGSVFDPASKCPRFQKFMSEIFAADDELISFVQRSIGYCLTGSTSEQCLFLCVGKGANGKSTFLRVIQTLLGDYAGSTPMHTLMESNNDRSDDLAALKGKRFVVAQEGEFGRKLHVSKIKLVTGDDLITCRYLYGNLFTYEPQFKLWLATNDLPAVRSTGEAIWRRFHVIQFPVSFPPERQDRTLLTELTSELPGILNWALDGLAEWTRIGLSPPQCVKDAVRAYRAENDTVQEFLEAACVLDPSHRTMNAVLHAAYSDWCRNSGYEPLPASQFGKELSRLGIEPVKGKKGNGRIGIRIAE